MDAAHDLHGPLRERRAAQPAAADLVERRAAGVQPFAVVRAIGRHDAVERRFEQNVADFVDHGVRHVGRYLEHDRTVLVLSPAEVEQRVENPQDMCARMGRAFAARVVAADVHGEVICVLVEVAEEFEIVGRGVFGGGRSVAADVAADDESFVGPAQVLDGFFETAVRKPDAVDDRLVLREPEDAGAGIARLRTRRHGADLDESEAEGRQFAERLAVAVETCGQPDGVGEFDAEDLAFERGVFHGVTLAEQPPSAGNQPDGAQQYQYGAVRPLDGEREEDGLYDATVHDLKWRFRLWPQRY